MLKARHRKASEASRLSLNTPLSPNLHVFTNQGALWIQVFRYLWRLHYISTIDYISDNWRLIQFPAPFPSWKVRGWDLRSGLFPALSINKDVTVISNCSPPMVSQWTLAGSQHEELCPWQRSWERRLRHTQRRDRASGNPLFPSIYPQNQSLPTLLFHALTYTSDFMGGCSPPVLSEKE